jgi:competence protein ComEA
MKTRIHALQSCLLLLVSLFLVSASLAAIPAKTKTQVDLNTASVQELTALPGVGPATAQRIIAARPFKNVEDLQKVRGIGKAKFESLKDKVTVESAAGRARMAPATREPAPALNGHKPGAMTTQPSGRETGKPMLTGPVDINTADLKTLEALPGVGPVKAQAIIDHRPYATIDDIKKVPGIKEGTFNKIKDRIVVK